MRSVDSMSLKESGMPSRGMSLLALRERHVAKIVLLLTLDDCFGIELYIPEARRFTDFEKCSGEQGLAADGDRC